MVQKQQDMARS